MTTYGPIPNLWECPLCREFLDQVDATHHTGTTHPLTHGRASTWFLDDDGYYREITC